MRFDHEESLGGGLRYTETCGELVERYFPFPPIAWLNRHKPARLCRLWLEGEEEPVSYLTLFSYTSRFGSVELPVEGYGGVSTPPRFRRRGFSSTLMRKTLASAAERVPLVYLNGVAGYYGKFGFATCLLKSEMTLSTIGAECAGTSGRPLASRGMLGDDLSRVCEIANRTRELRTGTLVRRPETYSGPREARDWDPGERGIVVDRGGEVVGYAVLSTRSFGAQQPLVVPELAALDREAVAALVAEVAQVALSLRIETIRFEEIPDSRTGSVLRQLGCEARITFETGGGWMGRIQDRDALVERLRPELERRAAGRVVDGGIEALRSGAIVSSDALLLQLLTGYVSWSEALEQDTSLGASGEFDAFCRRVFPGAGSAELPLPYQYTSDWF